MSQDDGVAARAAGKARVAREVIWALQIRGVCLRCRPIKGDLLAVEMKTLAGWAEIVRGQDPLKLFMTTVSSELVRDQISGKDPKRPA